MLQLCALLISSFLLACAGATSYPHEFGPFILQEYPNYTLGHNSLTGKVWLRINDDFDKIQFRYDMDQDPTTTPYWPFFAMHLHYGEVKAGNQGGPIVITIRGKGNITGYTSPSSPVEDSVCSDTCLPGALGCDPYCPPNNTYPHIFAYAYACDGGCDGDARDGDGDKALAPSRYCDLDNDNPSNPPQNEWMDGRYSDERSGNSSDTGYSPYSIFKPGNFDKFCSYTIDFLPTLFQPGVYTYVALHSNYNSTGAPDLLYGTLLAIVNDGSGIDVMSGSSSLVGSSLLLLLALGSTLLL
mmetsp:Transcript_3945/g.5536  ORF Transcript_3945/g.5536 Transcript_3945/m.5536 type:complete len:298 (-) Transcript_3945:64-957(-)